MNFDAKTLFPFGLAAGGAALGHFKFRKYGKMSLIGGAALGYVAGRLIAPYLFKQPAPAPVQGYASVQGVGDYTGAGLPGAVGDYFELPEESVMAAPPVSAQSRPTPAGRSSTAGLHRHDYGEAMAEKLSHEQAGSLSDGTGLGSLAPRPGFSDIDVDAYLKDTRGGSN